MEPNHMPRCTDGQTDACTDALTDRQPKNIMPPLCLLVADEKNYQLHFYAFTVII